MSSGPEPVPKLEILVSYFLFYRFSFGDLNNIDGTGIDIRMENMINEFL